MNTPQVAEGPYRVEHKRILGPDGKWLGEAYPTVGFSPRHQARLFAASWDMLQALEAIEAHHVALNDRVGREESRSTTLNLARAALAKARST